MKHPVWVLNSALLLSICCALCFILFSRQKPPAPEDIEPSGVIVPLKGEGATVNISKIYENDLFGTYRKEIPLLELNALEPIPAPPMPKGVVVPPVPVPQFLDPLNITLKGIIVMINDDSKNRAIIADNKTNKETTYRIGQSIEDAQLIRILGNKVIFLRSNGQQEVLYLREKDAKRDPAYVINKNWSDVIQKINEELYYVSPQEFVARIVDLGEFIDKFDLLSVYKQGKSVAARIGANADSSLANALGLSIKDIILAVNGIPTGTNADRAAIYKKTTEMSFDDTIIVKVSRTGREMIIKYVLKEFKPKAKTVSGNTSNTVVEMQMPYEQLRNQQLESFKEKHKMAPTIDEIREKERANMMRNGRSTSVQHPKDENE